MSSKTLILAGGWEGHFPLEIAKIIKDIEAEKNIAAFIHTDLSVLETPETLASFDLVIPLWTMGTLSESQSKNLVTAIESGCGLLGIHGSADGFRENIDYQWMLGGQFVAHPGGVKNFSVQISNVDHEITRGIQNFSIHSEQYFVHIDPSINILATSTLKGDEEPEAWWYSKVTLPIAWTKNHGHGRVFYCSLGHHPIDLDVPEVRSMISRGLDWSRRTNN